MAGDLILGDALDELRRLPADSIDLIMTSPPYADMRRRQYGGMPPDKYLAWYSPIAAELLRVLKPAGNYICNFHAPTLPNGERSTLTHDLVAEHRRLGWRWHDEMIWHKTAHVPGRLNARLPAAWESCLHFTRRRRPYFDARAVRRPSAASTVRRLEFGKARNEVQESSTGSGHVFRYRNFDPYTALPSNVLVIAPIHHNVGHPAAYPVELPAFFIAFLSPRLGTVLDPFVGSGTTALAAERLGRRWIGIDRRASYIATARRRIGTQHIPFLPPDPPDPQTTLTPRPPGRAQAAKPKARPPSTEKE